MVPEINHSTSSNVKVKHERSYASTPFICLYGVERDGFYEGRTESHEQLFLHANLEQQTKESAVVDGTSCCVIL